MEAGDRQKESFHKSELTKTTDNGDDVKASSRSGGVGHLEKLKMRSRQAVKDHLPVMTAQFHKAGTLAARHNQHDVEAKVSSEKVRPH